MNQPARPRLSWPALLAGALLVATAAVAHAASGDDETARVHVVGQLSLRDACPDEDPRDLADQLAPAWEDATRPSTVEVNFRVRRQHVYDVTPATDVPRVRHQIRRAVNGLRCEGGDDEAHAVRVVVGFVERADARSAAIAAPDAGR